MKGNAGQLLALEICLSGIAGKVAGADSAELATWRIDNGPEAPRHFVGNGCLDDNPAILRLGDAPGLGSGGVAAQKVAHLNVPRGSWRTDHDCKNILAWSGLGLGKERG